MKHRSFGVVEILFLLVILLLLVCLLVNIFHGTREPGRKAECKSSLNQIGRALHVYANSEDDAFPRVLHGTVGPGSEDTIVGTDVNAATQGQSPWRDLTPRISETDSGKDNPFDPIHTQTQWTVSSCLWLLNRLSLADPNIFICPSVNGMTKDELKDNAARSVTADHFSDFYCDWQSGAGPLINYSFQNPWANGGWNSNARSGFVIAADANNGPQPNYQAENWPLTENEQQRYVNSRNHEKGSHQNVLRVDGAALPDTAYAGVNGDNIYTALPADYTGKPGDTAGILSVHPRDQSDTVLIPVRDVNLTNWNRKP